MARESREQDENDLIEECNSKYTQKIQQGCVPTCSFCLGVSTRIILSPSLKRKKTDKIYTHKYNILTTSYTLQQQDLFFISLKTHPHSPTGNEDHKTSLGLQNFNNSSLCFPKLELSRRLQKAMQMDKVTMHGRCNARCLNRL